MPALPAMCWQCLKDWRDQRPPGPSQRDACSIQLEMTTTQAEGVLQAVSCEVPRNGGIDGHRRGLVGLSRNAVAEPNLRQPAPIEGDGPCGVHAQRQLILVQRQRGVSQLQED